MHAFSHFGIGPPADFGDIPAQVVGVKLGPSLVKTMDVWGSGRSGPRNIVPGVACAWAWWLSFFCGLCLILSNALQPNNRSSHSNWGWVGGAEVGA